MGITLTVSVAYAAPEGGCPNLPDGTPQTYLGPNVGCGTAPKKSDDVKKEEDAKAKKAAEEKKKEAAKNKNNTQQTRDCKQDYCPPFTVANNNSGPRDSKQGMEVIENYVTPLIKALTALVGIAVTISVVWGAIQYSTAGGDAGKVEAAKKRIMTAIVTLVFFIFFYAFLNWLLPNGIPG